MTMAVSDRFSPAHVGSRFQPRPEPTTQVVPTVVDDGRYPQFALGSGG